ncbi:MULTISPECIES: hypothetical protein [unclassified Duganella]|uniref:hypothetical protein n=1 Tax=unclassified Duganella TaxID=2636909 RepID=UPI0006F946E2|nr:MULTISPECIES: hypothetical protein [unclassified Duganella]KQV54517.1 hypothetical protein ASD07_08345 [Duganella sp. Root336D2]KRC03642.1 hypothetical protein ASE26_02070 [Duganella sp. Root198D2]
MTIFIKKMCNAFITDAVVNRRIGGAAGRSVEAIGAAIGGLWVGGIVTVSADALDWIPNIMNKAVHDDLQPVHIPLRDVRSVRRVFGILTGIVVVELEDGGEFRFRCFNARSVAENMSDLLPSQVMSA